MNKRVTMDDLEAGKLIASVEQLTVAVKLLTSKVDQLESQMDRGKGIFVGFFLLAGFLGYAGSAIVTKVMSFIGH